MKDPDHNTTSSEQRLEATVEALVARVAAIEARLEMPQPDAVEEPKPPTPPAATVAAPSAGFQLPAVGISFLMLAGAFLLRAVTEAGTLPAAVGVVLGLGYVLVLFFLTDHAARRDQPMRANVYGSATILVAFPFVWETTTKLGLLPAPGAAAVTAVIIALGLWLALRRRLSYVAWFVLLAGVVTCAGLYWNTDASVYFLAVLVALGAATIWLAYQRGWQGPQWIVAMVANFLVFLTVMLAAHPAAPDLRRPEPDAAGALLLAIALPVIYLASFSWRTLVQRRDAGVFEIVQSLGAVMAGYVGAIHLLRVGDRSTAALGWATLIAAVAGYVAAFMLVRSRQGRGLNFFYHAWLGLLLTLIGSALVVSGQWLPFLWCSLGVAAAVTGGVFDRWTLRLHCSVYLIGAAVVTGMPDAIFDTFIARATPTFLERSVAGGVVWLVTVVCYGLLVAAQRGREVSRWRRVPRFLVATLALIGTGVLLVSSLAAWLTDVVPGPEAGIVAAVRTAVLAGSALFLAAMGRRELFRELSWFTSPLLVLTGLKVLLEDLRAGTPVSLFFGFACLGIALIVAPRLRQRTASADSGTGGQPATDATTPNSEGPDGHETP